MQQVANDPLLQEKLSWSLLGANEVSAGESIREYVGHDVA